MTAQYTIIQIIYWSMFCGIYAFANNYLTIKGFYPQEIGLVISIASLASVFIQPLSAKLVDRYMKITVRKVLIFSLLVVILGSILLLFFNSKIIILPIYIFIVVGLLNSQTFIYTFIFEYINNGIKVDFGIARGMGSISFAITSFLLGKIGAIINFNFIPIISIIFSSVVILLIGLFKPIELKDNKEENNDMRLYDFYKKYKKFSYMLIGVIFIFFTHNSLNTFLKNIIETFEKNPTVISEQIGIGFMLAASVELPVMYFITKLILKFGNKKLLTLAGIFFVIKALITVIAMVTQNINIYYLAQITQLGGYAIYTPVTVYYTNSIMEEKDKVKGQAYLATAATIGAIIGTYSSGEIIRLFSATTMAYTSLVVSAIGAFFFIINLENVE